VLSIPQFASCVLHGAANFGIGTLGKDRSKMDNAAFQLMLDSGWLYLAVGAVLCAIVGVSAVRHLFQGAKRAEPRDPPRKRKKK
jgi:hypothetical protein